ncbi:MAG: Ig-like domain-containing protein [Acidobacteria bacterium]|nr:Ig-like domain-containing protein [Acidobacteriota bacterium]
MTTQLQRTSKISAALHTLIGHAGVAIFVVATASACADSPGQPSPIVPPVVAPTVTNVVVTGDLAVTEGTSTQLTATATMSDGSERNVTSQSTWTSGNTSVATVSGTGLLTSVAAGAVDITAVYQGRTGKATARVGTASYRFELVVESVTALDTCDDFTQGLANGEFAVRALAVETDGGQTSLVNTGSYPGNPDSLRVFNLGRNESQPINARRTFTVPGRGGEFVRLQFNATEWDEQIVVLPPSTRWVPDGDMNNRSSSRTHTFANGTFNNLGPNTLTLGNSSCGVRLNYTVTATRQ